MYTDADCTGTALCVQSCSFQFLQVAQNTFISLYWFEEEISGSGEKVLIILDEVVNNIRKNKGVDQVLAKILYNRDM